MERICYQLKNIHDYKVEEEDIIIDANHPLAGQDLVFDLEVVEIL